MQDVGYKQEVSDWLNSTECKMVFSSLESKLLEQFHKLRPPATTALASNSSSKVEDAPDPVYVYLAADNEDVKDKFHNLLMSKKEFSDKMKVSYLLFKYNNMLHFLLCRK